MLDLKNIVKVYKTGGDNVVALKGVTVSFRKNEFVAILGQSGCGKTTLLNIIGGLDRYSDGDLAIAGRSTKEYRDRDWDDYRNRSVGFVFQSYNLIPHQSVLSNVELALTLTGVSKQERRKRAKEVLDKVGLGDQLKKKPSQLSGGQMQRVAIARALVNDPEILLADEPTGALDSETSEQIMALLKEVANDRLVIMVTHNPDLAERYSTRTIRLLDGRIISDTMPYDGAEAPAAKKERRGRKKKPSMSFFTALSLSVNNLMTKKARTILTSFAGSIGIIGIALIMSVSGGVQAYIDSIERDAMASYPLTINATTMDTSAVLLSLIDAGNDVVEDEPEPDTVYSIDVVVDMMESMTEMITTNNLTKFKEHIESTPLFAENCNDVQYSYDTGINFYLDKEDGSHVKGLKNAAELYEAMGLETRASRQGAAGGYSSTVWQRLVGDDKYIEETYTVLSGHLPRKADEAVLIVDEKHQISDYSLYCLGLRDASKLKEYLDAAKQAIATGTENEYELETRNYSFEELCGVSFSVLSDADYYKLENGRLVEKTEAELVASLGDALKMKIVGIVEPADENELGTSSIGLIGYTGAFMDALIERVNGSEPVKAQRADTDTDLFTGIPFETKDYTVDELRAMLAADPETAQYAALPDDQVIQVGKMMTETRATYDGNLELLGAVDSDKPSAINIYPKDFDSKKAVTDAIKEYNDGAEEEDVINYTDMADVLIKSVGTIVDAISYVLIAFVAISLVVSSIMIGIITYISVLERTKEIGILRSIGASKRDVSRVFNAETTFVGFTAGVIGIGLTLLLIIPINAILISLTGITTLAARLPLAGAVVLVLISVLLTYVAGLIPSGFAARRDPVEALRTE